MTEAFVDTTVLVNTLLKTGRLQADAKKGLSRYDRTLLPVYALKEMRGGPLTHLAWIHNKLEVSRSFATAMEAVRALQATPQRYKVSTSLEALAEAWKTWASTSLGSLAKKGGKQQTADEACTDFCRIAIRTKVMRAWQRRRSVTTEVVEECPCWEEAAPKVKSGLLEFLPNRCRGECSMGPSLKGRPDDLMKLHAVCKQLQGREHTKRTQALRNLFRKPKEPLDDKNCRALGDAVFTLLAPPGAEILTTNLRDHGPLAAALGKKAVAP